MSFLERLQQQSPSTKANIAFTTASVVTVVVLIVWAVSMPASLGEFTQSETEGEAANAETKIGLRERMQAWQNQLGSVIGSRGELIEEPVEEKPDNELNLDAAMQAEFEKQAAERRETEESDTQTDTAITVSDEDAATTNQDMDQQPGVMTNADAEIINTITIVPPSVDDVVSPGSVPNVVLIATSSKSSTQ